MVIQQIEWLSRTAVVIVMFRNRMSYNYSLDMHGLWNAKECKVSLVGCFSSLGQASSLGHLKPDR